MKKIVLTLFFITFQLTFAQNAQDIIDGLKKELKTNPDEKRTATIYSDLTWYYSNISTDSALVYGEKALDKANQLNDSTMIAQVYSDVGAVYYNKGELKLSKKNYLNALKIRKLRNDTKGIAKINMNLASIEQTSGNYEVAMRSFLQSLTYFTEINDLKSCYIIKNNIANLFYKMKNYDKALKYSNKIIKYNEEKKSDFELCKNYTNRGNIYRDLKDTVQANIFYKKALIACKNCADMVTLGKLNFSIGLLKKIEGKENEANQKFIESKKIREKINLTIEKEKTEILITDKLIQEKKYIEAKKKLLFLKNYFFEKKSNENLLFTYERLIIVNSYLNQPDSVVNYIKTSTDLNQLNVKLTQETQNNELEAKYQFIKKEQQIAKKNNQIIIASIVALSFLLLGFLVYKNQKTKNKQQQQESALKEALLKIEAENQLQEQRLGISKELHDNIGSQLTFVISAIDTLKQNYPSTNEKIDNQLENINAFTKNTITELRDTVWVMNTKDIDANALKERLLENIERAKLSHNNIAFKVNIDNFEIENSGVALNLFRTIQEAVNNALKYAKASEIEISIHEKENKILALVADNGLGFDLETVKKGNGLKNMKKRIQTINGTFNIESSENLGTKINISISQNS